MEKKFDTSEKVRKELEEHMETMRKVLKDKEREIKDAKDQLCQSKEAAIHEYRDSNALQENALNTPPHQYFLFFYGIVTIWGTIF